MADPAPRLILPVVFCLAAALIQNGRPDKGLGDGVWVTVGSWSTIFKVTESFLSNLAGNSNTGAAVGNASGEIMDAGGFMLTSQTPRVVLSATWVIDTDVVVMTFTQFFNGIFNVSKDKGGTWSNDTQGVTFLKGKYPFTYHTKDGVTSEIFSFRSTQAKTPTWGFGLHKGSARWLKLELPGSRQQIWYYLKRFSILDSSSLKGPLTEQSKLVLGSSAIRSLLYRNLAVSAQFLYSATTGEVRHYAVSIYINVLSVLQDRSSRMRNS